MAKSSQHSILIIDPNQEDLTKIKVIFSQSEYDKLFYAVQFIGMSDIHTYETFIWFEKDGQKKIFFEYEDIEHMSFHYENYQADLEKFTELIEKYEYKTNFAQTIRRH